MKYIPLFVVFFIVTSFTAFTQDSKEAAIRKMEEFERQAVLKLDSSAITKVWSDSLAVNGPSNSVVDKRGGMFAFTNGFIHYSSFEKSIEKILFTGNIAIVMGQETVMPIGKARNAGKTIKRRYTNIWSQKGNEWTLFARQATNISIE